ncbi:nuclear transport factor 2 family protein [Pseudonocardia humida]|uniref:Nuclear transport factor 2 family protein n=1 Tax=Pseudonocardia humida TaxID=2800819 RepID=A0ABT0ZU65_9PSEU|nr:nuclear transport factor 2 family protein [Pseudonocardia humida]MCO1654271.1 nuclear transport factor 2 family protein [Pseudonocardia humida]
MLGAVGGIGGRTAGGGDAVPDLTVDVGQVLVDGDMVARRLRSHGHRDGRPVELRGTDMVRVRDGKLVEHRAVAVGS